MKKNFSAKAIGVEEDGRAAWKGVLTFGLVTFPIKVYPAQREFKSPLHQYRKSDSSPIRHKKVAEKDGIEVEYNDIVKGFEYEKGKAVMLTHEELQSLIIDSAKLIDINNFVPINQIDARLFEKPYFLEADKGGAKGYSLLYQGLLATDTAGIAKVAIRGREYLVMVVPNPAMKALMLEALRWPNELILPDISGACETVDAIELNLVKTLIKNMQSDFKPELYKDKYAENLMRLVESKVKGAKPTAKTAKEVKVTALPDIVAILQASVKKSESKKKR